MNSVLQIPFHDEDCQLHIRIAEERGYVLSYRYSGNIRRIIKLVIMLEYINGMTLLNPKT